MISREILDKLEGKDFTADVERVKELSKEHPKTLIIKLLEDLDNSRSTMLLYTDYSTMEIIPERKVIRSDVFDETLFHHMTVEETQKEINYS